NGADTDGDGALGHFLAGCKGFAIVLDRFRAELFHASAGAEARHGLVESDVSIAADAEKLQVDSAGVADGLLVLFAIRVVITGERSFRDVDAGVRNIHVSKQMLLHKGAETLRMRWRNAEILVEIEPNNAREIKMLFAVQANEFAIEADHRAAG